MPRRISLKTLIAAAAVLGAGVFATNAWAVKEGELCAGIAAIQCDKGLWCDPEPGLCDGADVAGKCVVTSGICTQDFDPVCGCDKKTYSNDCERRQAQVALDFKGACKDYKK